MTLCVTRPQTQQPICKKCKSLQIALHNGEHVCRDCGRVDRPSYDFECSIYQLGNNSNGYKRWFYFNERCTRWSCCEPRIHPELWDLIKTEAQKESVYGDLSETCNRTVINQILRAIDIPPEVSENHRSKKFKKQLLTKKRFYDKFSEKWKTIRWRLTGTKPIKPHHDLVNQCKVLFLALQDPWEKYRHHSTCDGRRKCERWFKCLHNFLNYDYVFRVLLRVCEERHGFVGCYGMFKEEFILPSKNIIKNKLKPLMFQMCRELKWLPLSKLK
jgi:hypothetical protein